MARPAKQQETTNIRIGADTHQNIRDVAAALRLKRGLRVTPSMDEVIKESLNRFATVELSGGATIAEARQR